MKTILGLCAALVLASATAHADSILIAQGEGWCGDSTTDGCGSTDPSSVSNHFSGYLTEGNYRNWFAFDVPTFSGAPITGATIRIWNNEENCIFDPDWNCLYNVGPDTTLYSLYAASDISHAGLIAGPALGSVPVGIADTGVGHYVDIALNATTVSLLNNAQGSLFLFGGELPADDEIFGYTWGTPLARLVLQIEGDDSSSAFEVLDGGLQAIPEPASVFLVAAGFAGLARCSRRPRSRHRSDPSLIPPCGTI